MAIVKNIFRNLFLLSVGMVLLPVQIKATTYHDLPSFNNCLKRSNVTCTLAKGRYDVHETYDNPVLEITGSNVVAEGHGMNATIIRRGNTSVLNLMIVSGSSAHVIIRKLRFNGANNFWNQSYRTLKAFLEQGVSQGYQDLKLNTASTVNVHDCKFVESGRYAIHFSGSNVTISDNSFIGGLDAAIRSHYAGSAITHFLISGNDIRHYRAAGIGLFNAQNGIVRKNHLYHNHFGDPYGADVGMILQGGGQLYLGAYSSNNIITKNRLDGACWEGSGEFYPVSKYQIMNYGIEIDGLNEPGKNNTFSANIIINHGVSGYWIGGNNTQIVLVNEIVRHNKVHGIQVLESQNISGVDIRKSYVQYNDGWNWPNGAPWPKGYALWMMHVAPGGVRIDNDTILLPNAGGDQCQFDGSRCLHPVTSSYRYMISVKTRD